TNAPSISISHAAGTVVLAVSEAAQLSGGPIGVDIESMDEVSPLAVSRMAATEERAWIDTADNQRDRCRRMCQVWTRIEAILKAEGVGFSIDPRKDGMPDGWNTSSVTYGRCVISCAARSTPRIVLKEHTFRVA
ncbi:MAG: 4'-phosphopantetheinyl transferase superfamily protein, partial [Collinsella sp.]|nr:4'-phosphopantetheinyl transferase superfamily protein [Collinsella sp.]